MKHEDRIQKSGDRIQKKIERQNSEYKETEDRIKTKSEVQGPRCRVQGRNNQQPTAAICNPQLTTDD
jgi:hypothetical protein